MRRPPVDRMLRLVSVSGRERLGLQMRDVRAALLDMCAQPVSAADAQLCERAAMLAGHLAVLDARALGGNGLSASDARLMLSLGGQYTRILRMLGARREESRGPSLREFFAPGEAAD